MNTAAEVTGYVVWGMFALVVGSLGLALANGWRVERAERRVEAARAHPSFTEHADQAIALGCEDWRHDVRRELEKADFALWALSFGDDAA